MPCGGIFPCVVEEGATCWVCDLPNPDCFLEEWDGFIHSACVEEFLYTEEGDIVLQHGHGVVINEKGAVKTLFPERTDGKHHPSLRDVAIAAGRLAIEYAKDFSHCYFCKRYQDDGGDGHDEDCPLAPLNPPSGDDGGAEAGPGDAPQRDGEGG